MENWLESCIGKRTLQKSSARGFLRPKNRISNKKKTSPAEESMPKSTEFCGRCFFWGIG